MAGSRSGPQAVGWSRWARLLSLIFSAFSCVASTASAETQQPLHPSVQPFHRATARPPDLTVYLMTMGPGKAVWERFGHNAIWIHDPQRGTDRAYNYGLFDLQQERFLVRFLQGRMWYWMEGFPAESYVDLYRRANRSVWVQELEMPLEAKRELQEFLEWNERPENRFYHYDYYRDNCSTRVRDALDRALGGLIEKHANAVATGRTFRFHTRRLTANDPAIYTGLLLGLGQPVDREISAWDEMFLPLALRDHLRSITITGAGGIQLPLVRAERTLFESTATPPLASPPSWLPVYLILGLLTGGAMAVLGSAARRDRRARTGFLALSGTWAFVVGILGLVLAGLWGLTDHTAAYRNENLLQLNPLVLALLWVLPTGPGNHPKNRRGLIVAVLIAGLALAGLVLKLLPQFYQVNGEIVALALPVHLGIAVGVWQLTRTRATAGRMASRALV